MKILSYIGAALLGLAPLNAQILINPYQFGGAAPSYVLKDSNTGTSVTANNVTFGSASRMGAGSFTAGSSYTLARVDVYVNTVGTPVRDITCQIWSTTGTTPDTAIGTESAAVSTSTFPSSEGIVSFYPAATIVSGTTYHIVLKGTTSSSSNYFQWHRTAGSHRFDQSNDSTVSWTSPVTSIQMKFAAYAFE